MITVKDVQAAAARLTGEVVRTPLHHSAALDAIVGAEVLCKCEQFQHGGAFKFRGALHAIELLPVEARARGVFAYSSGNHAQAVALAAARVGIPATILMPHDAPAEKVAATRNHGAEIVHYDRYTQDRTALAEELAAERSLPLIRPFDDEAVMAGQGTLALEVLDDVDDVDVFITPLGGGGLLSGCATVVRRRSPATRILGVEPATGDDFRRSLAAGQRVRIDVPRTIADGLQTEQPGAFTFEVVQSLVDAVEVATDDEIVAAMRLLRDTAGLQVEPSAAVGLAAILAGRIDVVGKRVVLVLTGGNITAERFDTLVGGAVP